MRATQIEDYEFRAWLRTTVFNRTICPRITIVYLRDRIRSKTIVDVEIRSKTDTMCGLHAQEMDTILFHFIYGCISPYTTRKYTIVFNLPA